MLENEDIYYILFFTPNLFFFRRKCRISNILIVGVFRYLLYNFSRRRNYMRNDILKSFALKAKKKLLGKENEVRAKIKVISFEDEAFKEKVEYLVSKEDEIFNPIHFLMDDKVMKTLDSAGKERYLLSTIDKYMRYKNEIIEEKSC